MGGRAGTWAVGAVQGRGQCRDRASGGSAGTGAVGAVQGLVQRRQANRGCTCCLYCHLFALPHNPTLCLRFSIPQPHVRSFLHTPAPGLSA